MYLCFASLVRKPYTMCKLCSLRQFAKNAAESNCIGREWMRRWMK